MSNHHLPLEVLDNIVDLLHDEPEALKQCCLASKSWVPRTRRHLFADIKFRTAGDLMLWKKTFPDSANSPAHHARTLFVGCPKFVVAADAEDGGWIGAFSRVASLDVDNGKQLLDTSKASLAPFRKFSYTIKSLRMSPILHPCPQLFNLIQSSPLLENLNLTGNGEPFGDGGSPCDVHTVIPSTSPPLTGSLTLSILEGMGDTVRPLLDLPNGLHFRRLTLSSYHGDSLRWITALVEECSDTLEFLHVAYTPGGTSASRLHLHP